MRSFVVLAPLTLLGVLVTGCSERDYQPPPPQQIGIIGTMAPYPQVPAVLSEDVPNPPVSGQPLIWQPGHWDWTSVHQYVWLRGRWVIRSGHGTMWQDGYWSRQNNEWVWIPAHWV